MRSDSLAITVARAAAAASTTTADSGELAVAETESESDAARRPLAASPAQVDDRRRRSAIAAMSEPCPPAFMRTAPPIDPGTPTAHSNPVSPAAAVLRATTGSAEPAEAVTHRAAAVDVDVGQVDQT